MAALENGYRKFLPPPNTLCFENVKYTVETKSEKKHTVVTEMKRESEPQQGEECKAEVCVEVQGFNGRGGRGREI
jgi:hypothetical protein